MNTVIKIVITAITAYGLSHFLSGVHILDIPSAFVFALSFAVLNLLIKPILKVLAFPITLITLGLFSLVINALIVLLADYFIDAVKIDSFWWAFIFSIALSIITSFLNSIFEKKEEE